MSKDQLASAAGDARAADDMRISVRAISAALTAVPKAERAVTDSFAIS